MLENLVIAMESDGQLVDLGRVAGFMQRVSIALIPSRSSPPHTTFLPGRTLATVTHQYDTPMILGTLYCCNLLLHLGGHYRRFCVH